MSDQTTIEKPWSRISYAAWERHLRPVTTALLKNKPAVFAEIDGWKFKAVKSYRSRLYQGPGPAWFAHIRAEKPGEYALEGTRDEVIECLIHRARKAAEAKS